MKLIKTRGQLISNIESVENYLTNGTEIEKKDIRKLIRKGKCLVAYKANNETRFAPSRFLGYVDNKLNKHQKSNTKDGREANVVIQKALGTKLNSNTDLEKKYIKYCKNIGVQPSNYSKRKYWSLTLDNDFIENQELDGEFPEGKIVERIHKGRERSSKAITVAKNNFKIKNGKLFCQICGFDFEKEYGKLGAGFIEAHHIIPVSEMNENHKTQPNEIAMLCSNCHRMVHKKRPWLTMKKLNSLIK